MAILRWSGQVSAAPGEIQGDGKKLSRIEWFAIVGLLISATSLVINLYRARLIK
jgi:hypothetical protein